MTNVLDWLEEPDPARGIRFCQADGWELRTYAEIARDTRRMAALLRDCGITGGAVALQVRDPRIFAPAFLGALYAGLTPVPIAAPATFASPDDYASHAAAIVRVAAPAVVLADQSMAETAAATAGRAGLAAPLIVPDLTALPDAGTAGRATAQVALLQFTSGSSGTPKGVRVTADNLAANVAAIHGWLGVTRDDSCSSWLPLYHDMGLIGTFLGSVVAQIDLWLLTPVDFIRSPARWLECHGKGAATITTAPSFGYAYAASRLTDDDLAGADFSAWRVAMNGAERVDPRVAARFAGRLEPFGFRPSTFAPCYGMAEATLAVCGVRPGTGTRIVELAAPLRAGQPVTIGDKGILGVTAPADPARWLSSCGTPVPGGEVGIIGEDGAILPDGCFGEIMVTGASVAAGYQSADPGASAAFSGQQLRTGDAGFLLDGELYVVGRIGDSLKVRGRMVHAEDLEAALAGVPGVGSGRCAVALGSWQGRDRAIVVVESGNGDWLEAAVGVLSAALGGSVELAVYRARRGTIARTSSGKPRRRVTWQRACDGSLSAEVLHDTLTATAGQPAEPDEAMR
jgi:acyl-CoA synthetase (AMP-forming)/AMP-acid ligase II